MKKLIRTLLMTAFVVLTSTGCSMLQKAMSEKKAGETYHVSVQYVTAHEQPNAVSKVVGSLKMGDAIVVSEVVPLPEYLQGEADNWVRIADGSYIPGNTLVSKTLWNEQLSGLPSKGEVKVKNFTSSKHQDSDADLDQALQSRRELLLLLGANGGMSSKNGKMYPTELGEYIKKQSVAAGDLKINLPKVEPKFSFSPAAFFEIGPYQEFDMGAGLASLMLEDAIVPDHPATVYVKKIVDRLVKHSTLPYAYGGFHVIVLKDDATVNACAAPGGFIFITTGMLKYLKSEEELALILAHEIGHLEFHHSALELGDKYPAFAVATLIAGIDLNDPRVKSKILEMATAAYDAWLVAEKKRAALFNQPAPSEEAGKAKVAEFVNSTTLQILNSIEDSKGLIMEVLQMVGDSMHKGHAVEYEEAADRRAVSLAAAAGYDANALLDVLTRIKVDNNGFGEAYPVNRDELVKQFKASFKVETPAAVADYNAIRIQVEKISDADLFIKK